MCHNPVRTAASSSLDGPNPRLEDVVLDLIRIDREAPDYGVEAPQDGREAHPLLRMPLRDRYLLSRHSVLELQISAGFSGGQLVACGDGSRPGAGYGAR